MATHSGSEGKVFVGSNQIAEVKSWSLEVTADTVDASTIGSQWRKNQATIKSWAGSFDAFWDEADNKGQGALTAGRTVTLNLYPQGDEEGNTYFTGSVIITSISYKASFDGLVEAGFSFTGTDALIQSIVKPVEPVRAKHIATPPVKPMQVEPVITTPESTTITKPVTLETAEK